jgi:hypothetical protein
MATTTLVVFEGTPTLTDAKVETIKQWYAEAQGDEDKASSVDDACFYEGYALAMRTVLALLYGQTCSHCGAILSNEDCPNHGSSPEHA